MLFDSNSIASLVNPIDSLDAKEFESPQRYSDVAFVDRIHRQSNLKYCLFGVPTDSHANLTKASVEMCVSGAGSAKRFPILSRVPFNFDSVRFTAFVSVTNVNAMQRLRFCMLLSPNFRLRCLRMAFSTCISLRSTMAETLCAGLPYYVDISLCHIDQNSHAAPSTSLDPMYGRIRTDLGSFASEMEQGILTPIYQYIEASPVGKHERERPLNSRMDSPELSVSEPCRYRSYSTFSQLRFFTSAKALGGVTYKLSKGDVRGFWSQEWQNARFVDQSSLGLSIAKTRPNYS